MDFMQIHAKNMSQLLLHFDYHVHDTETSNENITELSPGDGVLVYPKKLAVMSPIHSYTMTGNYPL